MRRREWHERRASGGANAALRARSRKRSGFDGASGGCSVPQARDGGGGRAALHDLWPAGLLDETLVAQAGHEFVVAVFVTAAADQDEHADAVSA